MDYRKEIEQFRDQILERTIPSFEKFWQAIVTEADRAKNEDKKQRQMRDKNVEKMIVARREEKGWQLVKTEGKYFVFIRYEQIFTRDKGWHYCYSYVVDYDGGTSNIVKGFETKKEAREASEQWIKTEQEKWESYLKEQKKLLFLFSFKTDN